MPGKCRSTPRKLGSFEGAGTGWKMRKWAAREELVRVDWVGDELVDRRGEELIHKEW
jgi:hypothetical protein